MKVYFFCSLIFVMLLFTSKIYAADVVRGNPWPSGPCMSAYDGVSRAACPYKDSTIEEWDVLCMNRLNTRVSNGRLTGIGYDLKLLISIGPKFCRCIVRRFQLEYTEKDFLNRRVATISAYVSATQSLQNIYPFCKNPIEYFYKTNIENDLVEKNKFQKDLLIYLENIDSVWEPSSQTTRKGFQTTGNLFEKDKFEIKSLIKIIKKTIILYKKRFSNSKDLIIKKWPSKSNLNAWYVKLIQQGYQNSHIHPDGWISGVFYLKVPKFINKQDGSIKLTIDGYDYPVNKRLPSLVHSPKDFDLILFPSSLFHRTIPFRLKETRHVIAFDLIPL